MRGQGYMSALAPRAPSLLRDWLEVTGPRQRCTPCADIFFVHASRLLRAEMIQRPAFYAFWPQYYVSAWHSPSDSGSDGTLRWPGARQGADAEALLADECRDIEVFRAGLGGCAHCDVQCWAVRSVALCWRPSYRDGRGVEAG